MRAMRAMSRRLCIVSLTSRRWFRATTSLAGSVASFALANRAAGRRGLRPDDRPSQRADLVVHIAPALVGNASEAVRPPAAPVLDHGDRRVAAQLALQHLVKLGLVPPHDEQVVGAVAAARQA